LDSTSGQVRIDLAARLPDELAAVVERELRRLGPFRLSMFAMTRSVRPAQVRCSEPVIAGATTGSDAPL
jgi:hypothetical protein